MQPMSWTWNSFLRSGWVKVTLEGLLGDSRQMNSRFLSRNLPALPWLLLECTFCPHLQQQQMGSRTLVALPNLFPCSPAMQREIQTHSRTWAPGWDCDVCGFLNLPIQNQFLHWMALAVAFLKRIFWGQNCQSREVVWLYHFLLTSFVAVYWLFW